jgi:hypothetical protein
MMVVLIRWGENVLDEFLLLGERGIGQRCAQLGKLGLAQDGQFPMLRIQQKAKVIHILVFRQELIHLYKGERYYVCIL